MSRKVHVKNMLHRVWMIERPVFTSPAKPTWRTGALSTTASPSCSRVRTAASYSTSDTRASCRGDQAGQCLTTPPTWTLSTCTSWPWSRYSGTVSSVHYLLFLYVVMSDNTGLPRSERLRDVYLYSQIIVTLTINTSQGHKGD